MRNRQDDIVKTGYVGIGTNLLVVAGKAIVGFSSGSMAIMLDAFNNLADALSSIITIVGVKLAGLPADDKHPFGYGRIEYFAAIMVASMILITGGTMLVESVKGIFNPEDMEFSMTGLYIIAATIIVKLWLAIYTRRKGKELTSDALISSGTECMFDCLVSGATLVSSIIFYFSQINIDCWIASVISILIIKTGVEMLMSPINELLGARSSLEMTGAIKKRVKEATGVRGVYDVIIHNYGPEQNIGALHVEVEDTMNASELHHLTRQIQMLVYKEFNIFFTVGFYAHNQEGTEEAETEKHIREYVTQQDGVLNMHGFYISHDDKAISFDIVYSFKVHNPVKIRENVKEWLKKAYADYDINIGLDRNFSE